MQRLARIAEPMLRVRQFHVGRALFLIEPCNRLARFLLSRLESGALLFCSSPFNGEQFGLFHHFFEIVARPLQLHLERQDGLLFAMETLVHGSERIGDLRHARLERGDVGHRLIALGLFACDAIAQLFDLALDAKNGAPFVFAAARICARPRTTSPVSVAMAADVTCRRGKRRVQVVGDPRVGNSGVNRGSVRTRHGDAIANRHEALRCGARTELPCRVNAFKYHEAAAADVLLADQLEAGFGLFVSLDDDVLE